MCCPECGNRFAAWGVWRVSRYSCLPCPGCGTPLNRRLNLQFLSVVACVASPLALLALAAPAWPWLLAACVAAFVGGYLLDVLTVRLVKTRGWRGWWRGYAV